MSARISKSIPPSIGMFLSEPSGGAKHVMDAFKLVEPLLRHGLEEFVAFADDARGARRPGGFGGHLPVFGECAVSISAADEVVFTQEQHARHAGGSTGLKDVGEIRIGVAVVKSQLNFVRCLGEVVENRTLIYAIAAPRTGEHQHLHLPHEPREQFLLGRR